MPRKDVLFDQTDKIILANIYNNPDITIYDLSKKLDGIIVYKNLLARLKTYYKNEIITREKLTNTENRKVVLLNLTYSGKTLLGLFCMDKKELNKQKEKKGILIDMPKKLDIKKLQKSF